MCCFLPRNLFERDLAVSDVGDLFGFSNITGLGYCTTGNFLATLFGDHAAPRSSTCAPLKALLDVRRWVVVRTVVMNDHRPVVGGRAASSWRLPKIIRRTTGWRCTSPYEDLPYRRGLGNAVAMKDFEVPSVGHIEQVVHNMAGRVRHSSARLRMAEFELRGRRSQHQLCVAESW